VPVHQPTSARVAGDETRSDPLFGTRT